VTVTLATLAHQGLVEAENGPGIAQEQGHLPRTPPPALGVLLEQADDDAGTAGRPVACAHVDAAPAPTSTTGIDADLRFHRTMCHLSGTETLMHSWSRWRAASRRRSGTPGGSHDQEHDASPHSDIVEGCGSAVIRARTSGHRKHPGGGSRRHTPRNVVRSAGGCWIRLLASFVPSVGS
jgi:hypothetical protein